MVVVAGSGGGGGGSNSSSSFGVLWATIPNPRRPRVADSGIPYSSMG